jgi:hypothetical protein
MGRFPIDIRDFYRSLNSFIYHPDYDRVVDIRGKLLQELVNKRKDDKRLTAEGLCQEVPTSTIAAILSCGVYVQYPENVEFIQELEGRELNEQIDLLRQQEYLPLAPMPLAGLPRLMRSLLLFPKCHVVYRDIAFLLNDARTSQLYGRHMCQKDGLCR